MEERAKHSGANRNLPGCQSSRRISRTSRRSSSIGCRSLMIGRRSSAGILAWTSCQDPSRMYNTNIIRACVELGEAAISTLDIMTTSSLTLQI
ncbi:uncharacterized protein LOC112688472 isoform X2 [Sipha flava]|uniref:Uncharacterized protein LOC112688472 isoform X2 n=1 Tax=Sipha flava TaxID=143950 RepID=A0A8B8G2I2_9HEMI|nr:uncharacterized protein LOC112688472 isoform X2 [Sipha flava]